MNGRYYLYYSTFFATGNDGDYAESAIGVAVTDSLNNPKIAHLRHEISFNFRKGGWPNKECC